MQIKRSGNDLIDVWLENSSYVIEEVMGDHLLYLSFRIEKPVNFEINDYVEFGGNTFKIRYKEKIEKEETELGWEYSMTLYSSKYELQDVIFFLHGKPERRKNFNTYNGTASQMLALIVQNMNRESSGWSVGSCIETEFATFTFTDKNCGAVLDDVAKAFETEYWIEGKSISIGKREYSNPGLILGQGEGMGFRTLELNSVDQKPPVTVLYPYGSDKNLAANDYGHDYLVLPDNKLSLDKNVEKYGRFEESKQFEHIFPRGIFKVVKRIDEVTFISDVDFDIAAHLIDGEEVIVTFQDGGLAGYDLAILTKDKGQWIGWDNEKKQITLAVNDQENALKVPGDIHFSEGDTFILTGLKMPQKYIE
ncbi:MAG: hypothetical protein LUD74_02795, partial [Tannerellaceae bacterium]|nr:hypothetical protein [Tannerellaceae bacterium]